MNAAYVEFASLTKQRNDEAAHQLRLKQQKSAAQAIIDGNKVEAARLALANARDGRRDGPNHRGRTVRQAGSGGAA